MTNNQRADCTHRNPDNLVNSGIIPADWCVMVYHSWRMIAAKVDWNARA